MSSETDADTLVAFMIAKAIDPASDMATEERALYALLTVPKVAQSACSLDELQYVLITMTRAMEAAVAAALAKVVRP